MDRNLLLTLLIFALSLSSCQNANVGSYKDGSTDTSAKTDQSSGTDGISGNDTTANDTTTDIKEDVTTGSCTNTNNCADCLKQSGCNWTGGQCLSDCLQDTYCFGPANSASPSCPNSPCPLATDCQSCQGISSKQCYWVNGGCTDQCASPGTCYQNCDTQASDLGPTDGGATDLTKIDAGDAGICAFALDCDSCLDSNCQWTGGQCLPDCLQDTYCFGLKNPAAKTCPQWTCEQIGGICHSTLGIGPFKCPTGYDNSGDKHTCPNSTGCCAPAFACGAQSLCWAGEQHCIEASNNTFSCQWSWAFNRYCTDCACLKTAGLIPNGCTCTDDSKLSVHVKCSTP